MKTITTIKEMKLISGEARGEGLTVVLVPTMGFLHDGHIELLNRGREEGHFLVMSLFVNPTQFNDSGDLDSYPTDVEGDLEKAKAAGVDVVFMPTKEEMYPHKDPNSHASNDFQTTVEVTKLSKNLCGASREGHFHGVATVVTKLFNIVSPHKAVFGIKDFQQLRIIEQLVSDLAMDVKIIREETVREEDGLAMSSRNKRLTEAQRESAKVIPDALKGAVDAINSGTTESSVIIEKITRTIEKSPEAEIDYIKVCNPKTLEDIQNIKNTALIAVAVNIGKVRLIDNCLIN